MLSIGEIIEFKDLKLIKIEQLFFHIFVNIPQ